MKELRMGTVGTGEIVRSIVQAVSGTDGIRVEAVHSRSRERGETMAALAGAGKVYTDYAELLADPDVNLIYVAVPNLLHGEYVRRALEAGKHVLCEKPFVPTWVEAISLAALAKQKGLFLVEATPTTFLPNFPLLRMTLPRVGRVRLVLSNYSQYSSRYDAVLAGEKPARFDPAFAGGALMDINFYNAYLNVALFGAPKQADYYPNLFPGLADTSGVLVLRYEDFVSQNAGAKDTWGVNSFQIEGEKGYIYVEDGSNGLRSFTLDTRGGKERYNAQPETDRWAYEIRELTRLLLSEDKAALEWRLQVTLQTVRLLEKARRGAGLLFPCDKP